MPGRRGGARRGVRGPGGLRFSRPVVPPSRRSPPRSPARPRTTRRRPSAPTWWWTAAARPDPSSWIFPSLLVGEDRSPCRFAVKLWRTGKPPGVADVTQDDTTAHPEETLPASLPALGPCLQIRPTRTERASQPPAGSGSRARGSRPVPLRHTSRSPVREACSPSADPGLPPSAMRASACHVRIQRVAPATGGTCEMRGSDTLERI